MRSFYCYYLQSLKLFSVYFSYSKLTFAFLYAYFNAFFALFNYSFTFFTELPFFVRLFFIFSSSAWDLPSDAANLSFYFFSKALCLSTPLFMIAASLAAFASAISFLLMAKLTFFSAVIFIFLISFRYLLTFLMADFSFLSAFRLSFNASYNFSSFSLTKRVFALNSYFRLAIYAFSWSTFSFSGASYAFKLSIWRLNLSVLFLHSSFCSSLFTSDCSLICFTFPASFT